MRDGTYTIYLIQRRRTHQSSGGGTPLVAVDMPFWLDCKEPAFVRAIQNMGDNMPDVGKDLRGVFNVTGINYAVFSVRSAERLIGPIIELDERGGFCAESAGVSIRHEFRVAARRITQETWSDFDVREAAEAETADTYCRS